MTNTVKIEHLGTVGVKVFEKGSKRYWISMTTSAHTSPVKPRQLLKNPFGNVRAHSLDLLSKVTSRPLGHLRQYYVSIWTMK
ncbi:hypothetical protein TNCV_708581 [Trichonephila clavipes]|nr:hypothetical protein TNCV_708581 [Trichonephila clavipes]